MPEYSVWKPPTSSDSASTRSKGARFVSAKPEMQKNRNGMTSGAPYHWYVAWACTIPFVESVPAKMTTDTMERPIAAS